MGFVERVISNATSQLRVLAPPGARIPSTIFRYVRASDDQHVELLSALQRLRGAVYLRDGAISGADLDASGRHRSSVDLTSWHVVHLGVNGEVNGCARYRAHPNFRLFTELDARTAALARHCHWGGALRHAICYEHAESARRRKHFFEVSGWAIAEQARFSDAALVVALAMYALGGVLGGGRGIATATTRNHSSQILRRLGGRPLTFRGSEIPPYFDPQYGCFMEVVSFDTTEPHPKFAPFIQRFLDQLPSLPIILSGGQGAGQVQKAA